MRLAAALRKAVAEERFAVGLVDHGVRNRRTPVVDVAVIELGPDGRPTAVADVVLSKDYPRGSVVPVDDHLETSEMRWRRWNTEEWEAGSPGSVDVVPGRENASMEAMSPYPASVLKLMVAFGILRLVDRGVLELDETVRYRPAYSTSGCGGPGQAQLHTWLDRMITVSDNRATCVLVKKLHDLGEVKRLNATFQDLGLHTLQIRGTNPATGGEWVGMSMTALDTARLLLIVADSAGRGGLRSSAPRTGAAEASGNAPSGPGILWRTSSGRGVTTSVLKQSSRAYFARLLAAQGLNQALSTSNWCGRDYPARGIPQRVPKRWIDPVDGTVTVGYRVYGQDVRPCNRRAEVEFAHKTGRTSQAGADAGIVTSLPSAPVRRYVVAVFTNLGLRFADAHKPPNPPGVFAVPFTEKLAKLGLRIDQIMTARAARSVGQ
ncbi:serine hydrolase [Actinopolymorpha sp. NPDC004070]|uniref:serine hydrolase n=1 Tax=Actinopolymorpha sp. NPDC004070 TaxID=3154548 RepID=UPI0033B29A83